MNKNVTIIDVYAPTADKQNLLVNCIESCKLLNTDILLVSHCTLPERIVNMVDYYIFDKDNRFNENSVYAFKSINNLTVHIPIRESHEYPIIKSMRNAFILASGLGYDFFYFTEFDLAFSETDINKLKELREQLIVSNKDFIFFKPKNAAWLINGKPIFDVYYETNFFAGRIQPFIEKFSSYFPTTIEEYNRRFAHVTSDTPNCLEFYFYDAFNKFVDKSIVIDLHTKQYLADSKINISSYQNTKHMILRSTNQKDYLYITNENETDYRFKVYIDEQLHTECVLNNKSIFSNFQVIPLKNNCEIKIEVAEIHSDDVKLYTLSYDRENNHLFINNGYIETNDIN